jgi:hypothetical protein
MIKSRRIRWAGHVGAYRGRRDVYRMEKLEGKIPLRRPRRRWGNNIKMDLQELGDRGMDCNDMAQDRERWRAHL